MGEGQDKIARSLLDLEPTAILDLFLVYPDYNSQKGEVFAIHNGSLFKKGVVWQGRTYMPIGLEVDGFEVNADGRINRPKIKVSNKDYFVTSLLKKFDNFKSARVVQKRTFVKYLDDENFDGGNPFGQSDVTAEISSQQFIVAQKTQENKIFVEFELTSPLDLDNFELNHRRIMGKYCYWQYRGEGCRYTGPPIHKENGENFKDVDGNIITIDYENFESQDVKNKYSKDKQYNVGDIVYVDNSDADGTDSPTSNNIYNYYVAKSQVAGLTPSENPKYWEKDGCNKKLSSCKVHFPKNGSITQFIGLGLSSVDTFELKPKEAKDALGLYPSNNDGVIQAEMIRSQESWSIALNTNNLKAESYIDNIVTLGEAFGLYVESASFKFLFPQGPADQYGVGEQKALKTPVRAGLQDEEGLKNHPIIFGQKNEFTIFISEPSIGYYKEYEVNTSLGILKDAINLKKFSVCDPNNDSKLYFGSSGQDLPTSTKGSPMNIDSICVWKKALTQAEIERLYRKASEGGLRAKRYLDIDSNDSLLQDLENWWEGAFSGDPDFNPEYFSVDDPDNPVDFHGDLGITEYAGMRDLIKQDDVLLRQFDMTQQDVAASEFFSWRSIKELIPDPDKFSVSNQDYNYNIEQTITFGAGSRYIPFGGFPGTDGFDFNRA